MTEIPEGRQRMDSKVSSAVPRSTGEDDTKRISERVSLSEARSKALKEIRQAIKDDRDVKSDSVQPTSEASAGLFKLDPITAEDDRRYRAEAASGYTQWEIRQGKPTFDRVRAQQKGSEASSQTTSFRERLNDMKVSLNEMRNPKRSASLPLRPQAAMAETSPKPVVSVGGTPAETTQDNVQDNTLDISPADESLGYTPVELGGSISPDPESLGIPPAPDRVEESVVDPENINPATALPEDEASSRSGSDASAGSLPNAEEPVAEPESQAVVGEDEETEPQSDASAGSLPNAEEPVVRTDGEANVQEENDAAESSDWSFDSLDKRLEPFREARGNDARRNREKAQKIYEGALENASDEVQYQLAVKDDTFRDHYYLKKRLDEFAETVNSTPEDLMTALNKDLDLFRQIQIEIGKNKDRINSNTNARKRSLIKALYVKNPAAAEALADSDKSLRKTLDKIKEKIEENKKDKSGLTETSPGDGENTSGGSIIGETAEDAAASAEYAAREAEAAESHRNPALDEAEEIAAAEASWPVDRRAGSSSADSSVVSGTTAFDQVSGENQQAQSDGAEPVVPDRSAVDDSENDNQSVDQTAGITLVDGQPNGSTSVDTGAGVTSDGFTEVNNEAVLEGGAGLIRESEMEEVSEEVRIGEIIKLAGAKIETIDKDDPKTDAKGIVKSVFSRRITRRDLLKLGVAAVIALIIARRSERGGKSGGELGSNNPVIRDVPPVGSEVNQEKKSPDVVYEEAELRPPVKEDSGLEQKTEISPESVSSELESIIETQSVERLADIPTYMLTIDDVNDSISKSMLEEHGLSLENYNENYYTKWDVTSATVLSNWSECEQALESRGIKHLSQQEYLQLWSDANKGDEAKKTELLAENKLRLDTQLPGQHPMEFVTPDGASEANSLLYEAYSNNPDNFAMLIDKVYEERVKRNQESGSEEPLQQTESAPEQVVQSTAPVSPAPQPQQARSGLLRGLRNRFFGGGR